MDDLRFWLALVHTPGIGCGRLHQLLAAYESPRKLFSRPASELHALPISEHSRAFFQRPDWRIVDQCIAWLESDTNHHVVKLTDPDYPALLKEIPDPPLLFFLNGQRQAINTPQIAMVGSRNPTATGRQTAFDFAAQLAHQKFTITSGLALGIDTASHQGALSNHLTIAVLGAGLNRIYPKRNTNLAEQILTRGAVISEFPLNASPKRYHFPQRNRLISGLSVATLVVEANARSGSLITAKHAAEQGRDVFAVPGSIHNPLTRGCHDLIKQGAKLVETIDDIIEELPSFAFPNNARSKTNVDNNQCSEQAGLTLTPDYVLLRDAIGYEPTPFGLLITRTGLTTEAISSMLLILELNGVVETRPGGLYMRCTTGELLRKPQIS
ncbi:MAG: DNA-protecting protein DprA [Gammaproteobacteria bacterium]|nr:DNA-protecting protein DprA [Gammaproteobacteria bacterium]